MVLSKKMNVRLSLASIRSLSLSKWTAAISSLLLLAACGDTSSSKGTEPAEVDIMADTFVDLPVCFGKRDGAIAYVKDEKTAYICVDGDWIADSEDEESSSSEKAAISSSSSVIPSGSEESSSNIGEAASSSSFIESKCSAFLEGESDWSWDVPKECRFNPNITYGSMTDRRDNQTYKTVKIGDQTWMAENMNYADSTKTPGMQPRSLCYNNKAENCALAGRLYTWEAANDACPEGWHLPTQTEWNTLFTEVGGQSIAGKILKSQTGWGSDGNGTDGVGFSVLPAGDRVNYGEFYNIGLRAIFWSATESSVDRAYNVCLSNDGEDVRQESFPYKNNWFSVRCVKE